MPTIEELESAIESLDIKVGHTISFEFKSIGEPRRVTGVFSRTINKPGVTGIWLGENCFCGVDGIDIGSLEKI